MVPLVVSAPVWMETDARISEALARVFLVGCTEPTAQMDSPEVDSAAGLHRVFTGDSSAFWGYRNPRL